MVAGFMAGVNVLVLDIDCLRESPEVIASVIVHELCHAQLYARGMTHQFFEQWHEHLASRDQAVFATHLFHAGREADAKRVLQIARLSRNADTSLALGSDASARTRNGVQVSRRPAPICDQPMRAIRSMRHAIGMLVLCAVAASCRADTQQTQNTKGHTKLERAVTSPDGRLVARYYVSMGGGAAGWVNEIVDIGAPADSTLMKDDDAVFVMAHGGDLTMRWTDPRHLVLTYPGWADVTRGCRMARGVSITYVARPAPDSTWRDWARGEWRDAQSVREYLAKHGEKELRSPGLVGICR
jgi:hypothetical protein